jgi:hypothetical protein
MEDSMCWEIDHQFFAEQKKAQETRVKQEQRSGVIDKLLNDANKQGAKRRTSKERQSKRWRLQNSSPATTLKRATIKLQ